MERIETSLPGVFVVRPTLFSDPRGFFFESYHQAKFADFGITERFVQDNHSKSVKGTLRGLHYQLEFPQSKLCRVIQGEVLDVVADVRKGSPYFAKWVGVILSDKNKEQIYIPKGFAHGFLVLSETAEFLYKCDDFYHPEDEKGFAWNDPQTGIQWGIKDPILSLKDQRNSALSQIPPEFLPKY